MNLDLSEDESLLRDSVERWVQQNYAFEQRRQVAALPEGFSREHWRAFAQMGWLGLPFDESVGGLGGGAMGTALLMEQLGRGLVLEPYVPAVTLFGGLLARSPALRDEWVPKIIEGRVLGTLAFAERDSRQELTDVQTTLRAEGSGFRLDGRKVLVAAGAAADAYVVSARSSGGRFDSAGIDLVLVPAGASGVKRTPVALMDGQRCAQVDFDGVRIEPGQLLFTRGEGGAPLRACVDDAMLALCAEGLGIAQLLNDTTLEYVKTRKQFGVPIGTFQALQHRLVEIFITLEQMRSLLVRTVCAVQDGSDDARRCLHASKVMVGRVTRLIGGEAIQMHGGMGITDELVVGHAVKRLMVIDASFGNADAHRARFVALQG